VTLRFNNYNLQRPAFTRGSCADAAGKQIDKGDGRSNTSDACLIRRFRSPAHLNPASQGRWRAMSATRTINGDSFTFKVGQ